MDTSFNKGSNGRQNVEDEKQVEQDRQRAEVFDALGHPTRIQILKVLSEGSLGFADLKKKTGIDSSGHLQHHLNKLDGLIKTDEYGKYCLSDEGKDALLTVQTVENASPTKEAKEKGHRYFKVGLKPVAILLIALLIVSSAIAVYEYNQTVILRKEINPEFSQTGFLPDFILNPPWYQATNVTALNPNVTEVHGYAWYFDNVSQGLSLQVNITLSSETTEPINVPMENLTVEYYNSTINYSAVFPGGQNYDHAFIQEQAFTYSFAPNQVTLQAGMSNSTILTIELAQKAPLGQYTIGVNIGNPINAGGKKSFSGELTIGMIVTPKTT